MSYELRGACREWRMNVFDWEKFLKRGRAHGWHPAGTEAPCMVEQHPDGTETVIEGESWGGSYWSNDYQHVTDADAQALGDALERWLAHDPKPTRR